MLPHHGRPMLPAAGLYKLLMTPLQLTQSHLSLKRCTECCALASGAAKLLADASLGGDGGSALPDWAYGRPLVNNRACDGPLARRPAPPGCP